MLKSLAEKILAAQLLNAESDPEFQRDAVLIVQSTSWQRSSDIHKSKKNSRPHL